MTGQIRAVAPGEEEVVGDVIAAAFGEEGATVGSLWGDVRARGWVRRELVAVDDAIVGHVGLSHAWLDARRELVDVLVLSPLSTLPDRQKQGIGTALVRAALEAARDLGAPALFLEGSPAFYGARGFATASGHGFEAPSVRIPDPAFQVAFLDAHEDWMTGRVVYPDVWWRHDATGLRDPVLAELERAFGTA